MALKNFPQRSREGTHSPVDGELGAIFFLSVFVFREIENKQGRGREREREREVDRVPSRLRAVSAEPDIGSNPMNRELTT